MDEDALSVKSKIKCFESTDLAITTSNNFYIDNSPSEDPDNDITQPIRYNDEFIILDNLHHNKDKIANQGVVAKVSRQPSSITQSIRAIKQICEDLDELSVDLDKTFLNLNISLSRSIHHHPLDSRRGFSESQDDSLRVHLENLDFCDINHRDRGTGISERGDGKKQKTQESLYKHQSEKYKRYLASQVAPVRAKPRGSK